MRVRLSVIVFSGLSVAILCAVAQADTIVLKSGTTLEGQIIAEDADKVVIQTSAAKLTIERDKIRDIRRTEAGATPVPTPPSAFAELEKQYAAKLQSLQQDSAVAQFKLAAWCRDNRLTQQAIVHFTEAARCNPPHPDAAQEAAKLGVFLVRGAPYELEILLGPHAPVMRSQEKIDVWERLLAYAKLNPAQELQLLSRLTDEYDQAGRPGDIKRLWPRFAQAVSSRAIARQRHDLGFLIKDFIKLYPDGVYEVKEGSAGTVPRDPVNPGPEAETVSVGPGVHPLACPGVLSVAVRDFALGLIEQARKQINESRALRITNPLAAYNTDLMQAAKLMENAKVLVPDVVGGFALELATARVDTLQELARFYENHARSSMPPWRFFDFEPDVHYYSAARSQWESWVKMARRAADSYVNAIQTYQELVKVAQEFPDRFENQTRSARDQLMAADGQRVRLKDRIERVTKVFPVP